MPRVLIAAAILVALLVTASCKRSAPAEKTYELRGQVVSVNPQTKTATIKHEKIGDWMDAMTMEFPVRDAGEFGSLKPGQKITATVHTVPDTFEYWIAGIHTQGP